MAKVIVAKGRVGGGANDLDFVNATEDSSSEDAIEDGDFAFLFDADTGQVHFHAYDASDTDSEDDPNKILPDDQEAGTGAWVEYTPAQFGKEHTANVALTPLDFGNGKRHSNNGASGTVTLSLPSLSDMDTAGRLYCDALFIVMETQLFEGDPDASDYIRWDLLENGVGEKVYSSQKASCFRLMATADYWIVKDVEGAVFFE